MRRVETVAAALIVAAIAAAAVASETISFSYDARGRLIKVQHSGNVNNGVTTNYVYDGADNRILKNTTGVP